jgi:hypothetical protein
MRRASIAKEMHIRRTPYLEQGDPQAAAVLLLHAWVESSACFDRLLQAGAADAPGVRDGSARPW